MPTELANTLALAVTAVFFVAGFMAYILLSAPPAPPAVRTVTISIVVDISKFRAGMNELGSALQATNVAVDDVVAKMSKLGAAMSRPEWADVAKWAEGERAREEFLETAAAWPGTIMITLLPACSLTQFTTVENLALREGEGLLVWCNRAHQQALEEAIADGTLTNATIMGKRQ